MMEKLGQRDDNDLPKGSEAASKMGRPLKAVVTDFPKDKDLQAGTGNQAALLNSRCRPGKSGNF